MIRRGIGYGVWALFVIGLYFFENGTGTRIALIATVAAPFLPALRRALFAPDAPESEDGREKTYEQRECSLEGDEPGDIRPYIPGDPINRIHWKLSARHDELLIREHEHEPSAAMARITRGKPIEKKRMNIRKAAVIALLALMVISLSLEILWPTARHGALSLLNRLFTLSERFNAYRYARFDVPADQPVVPALTLALTSALALIALIAITQRRLPALCVMCAAALAQIYFGLALPAWAAIAATALFAAFVSRRPRARRDLLAIVAVIVAASLITAIFIPGQNVATEAASERARDFLSATAQRIIGSSAPESEGEMAVRHVNTRSLVTGDGKAAPDRTYRLVTVEEELISLPHWINYGRAIVMFLLVLALVILPFAPFLWMNARRKRALSLRTAFDSADKSAAVVALFSHVTAWLEVMGYGGGQRPYRAWTTGLPAFMPEGYKARFAACAALFEQAAYSEHALTEDMRLEVLSLLNETETILWAHSTRRQKLILRYGACLCV